MAISVEIIGMGLCIDDVTEKQKKIINKADLLVGGNRYLDYFKDIKADKLVIKKDINFIASEIKSRMIKEKIVVLASGDPLFFGIGSSLVKKIGRKNIIIHPNISSVISAFARIKEPWHDACFVSFHGKKDFCNIKDLVSGKNKIAILTDPVKNPAWIAKKLVESSCIDFEFYVFENLGNAEEKKIYFKNVDVDKIIDLNFKFPNIVILKKKSILECTDKIKQSSVKSEKIKIQEKKVHPGIINNKTTAENKIRAESETGTKIKLCGENNDDYYPAQESFTNNDIYPGMPDNLFFHERGLITKAEIRAVVLSKLKLFSNVHFFWDLGAGSGSVSIEASKFIPNGLVFAVEKNINRICDIKKNIEKFQISNINIIHADLPDGIENIPGPDRIFIGGGGKKLLKIMDIAIEKLASKGIIVINMVILQNIEPCLDLLKTRGFNTDLIQMQVSCLKPMPFGHRLKALNPVWIISGEKPL